MVLGCNIIQALWTAIAINDDLASASDRRLTYYFSTQGCRFWDSLRAAPLADEAPLVAATAAARALLLKKFAIGFQGHEG